jgi:hypothetical protein
MLVTPVLRNFAALTPPSSIQPANLKQLLNPDAATMYQDAGITLVSADNDPFARWADQSGNGGTSHTQQGTGADVTYRTNVHNSLPGAEYDANDWHRTDVFSTVVAGLDAPWTLAMVFKKDGNTGADTLYGAGWTIGVDRVVTVGTNGTSYRVRKTDDAGTTVNVDFGTSDTSTHLLVVRQNGTTVDAWLDGTQVATAVSQNVGDTNPTISGIGCLPQSSVSNFLEGDVGAVALWNIALSDADVAKVNAYYINLFAL